MSKSKRVLVISGNSAVDLNNVWWDKFFSYSDQEICSCCKVNLLGKWSWEREGDDKILCEECIEAVPLKKLIDSYKRGKHE